MPISGPVVHQQLMDAYANTQSRLESARGLISQTKQQRDELGDERSDALVRLAEHYLPDLTTDSVRQTWSEVRASIAQILLRKEEHVARLQTILADFTTRRQRHDGQLVVLSQQLDQAIETQQKLADQVERRLQDDDQFVQLSDRAAVAEAALERAEANLAEIDQDSVKKLPAYDDSSLFRYLHDRGFGTAKYQKRGMTRRMDRWLAKLIDYNKAKQSYEFLRKTPEQMREIIAEDRQALDTVMDELERRRDDVADELGLPEKISHTERLEVDRAAQLKEIDSLMEESRVTRAELTELDGGRGPYYRDAIKLFRDMLDRSDSRELKRRAERTIEITDDQIVARLMGVETAMGQLDQAARGRRRELDQMGSFLEDLGRVVQRFRAAQFDSSRSQFVGSLDIFEEVDRASEDGNTDHLWHTIRRSQRWGPTVTEKVTRIATHPLTQVLINAMAHAAGGAMQAHARRAGNRRAQRDSSWGGGSGSGSWGGDSSGWQRRR